MSDIADLSDVRPGSVLAGLGGAVTTFLLVSVPVVELLDTEFSAIVALPLGLLAGLAALMGIALNLATLHPVRRRAIVAYAAFGPAVLAVLALAYADVARDLVTVEVAVGAGLAATAAVYVGLGVTARDSRP